MHSTLNIDNKDNKVLVSENVCKCTKRKMHVIFTFRDRTQSEWVRECVTCIEMRQNS